MGRVSECGEYKNVSPKSSLPINIDAGRKEKMSYFKPELVEKLKTFFRPSYQEIYRMVGNDLGWN